MADLVLQFPLPPSDLSPNRSRNVHWSRKSKTVADYREFVCILARNGALHVGWVAPEKATVSLLWCLKDGRGKGYQPRDADNAVGAAKTLLDCLRDAGVLVDDTWAHMRLGGVDVDKQRGPYVEVTVSED